MTKLIKLPISFVIYYQRIFLCIHRTKRTIMVTNI
ncbi:hypothetical protein DR85_1781 [Francisella tularensis]|nr:hypothetical protein DR85_1781 [Francisella tularensis]